MEHLYKVPQLYFQLYTLHCQIGFSYPPFLYILLPKKTNEIYERMFQIVRQIVQDTPRRILLDYEQAAHHGVRVVYPEVHISGCFFHLRQSVLRNVQVNGLKARYEQDLEFATLIKCLTSLAFVPTTDVEGLFEELSDTFPEDDATDSVLAYFKNTYIEGPVVRRRQRPPMFPLELWNHFEDAKDMEAKTTNCAEGWHNTLRSLFLASHPSMWTLLRGLKKDTLREQLKVIT